MASNFKGNPNPIDPNVQVPAAVRRAAEAADKALQNNTTTPPPKPAPAPAPAPNDTITIAEPAPPQGLPGSVTTVEPAPPPQPPQEPQPPQPPQPELSAAEWKNRYDSMHGRFREASAQLVQQNSRITALENMLASVQSAPPAPKPDTPPQPVKFLTDKDVQEMGPEMIDFVQRAAREVAAPLIAQNETLQRQVADMSAQLNGTVREVKGNARERMLALLGEKLPNWNEINHNEDFHAWLALQDPFSGATRHDLLRKAYAANDGLRVLNIFQGFVSETAAMRPVSLDTVPAPAPQGQPARPTLESLAAPGRARTAASPQAPAEKQYIRTSDVNAFYADVRKGRYKGREAEQAAAEAELHAAMREGRIVQDT